ncbi:MAG TPA: dihydropyrimidinase [Desulfocapsa sulfexigens]|nr:dihydropyrimidinase [Desulfocapsa sulfexigens]
MSILVANGTVVTATRVFQSDILIENGCITAIEEDISRANVEKNIDAAGCYVMPGGVDVHTHMNLTVGEKHVSDGFYHGSVAAAHGGTTCIVEHPGFGPEGCELSHQIDLYQEQATDEMVIDYSFHGVVQHVDDQVLQSVASLTDKGIASLKVYLTYSGRLGDEEIIQVMKATRDAGGMPTFHAENHAIISELTQEFRQTGDIKDPASHPKSRPDYAEAEAINRLIALSRAAGNVPIYIVHLSTASGLEIIRNAQKQGLEIYAETCPQYLTLTDSCYREADDKGLQYIMAPPVRTEQDCDALWDGLADGTISVVATDHCAFSFAQKLAKGKTDIFQSPGGIPGVETRIPLLFSEGVLKKRIDMNRFVQLVSTNPARIMGLAPQKGDIAIGADADLMILDPTAEKTISREILHQHVDYTPFAGMKVTGWPRTVMVRGRTIVHEEKMSATKGFGNFVNRKIQT